MIKIEHLRKEYAGITPLKDINTVINDGDVISVIGPSGTGKSTLLRCINQLEKPTSGKIWVDDVEITDPKCDINKVRQKMGMVFQSFNLYGHKTVIENIMLAPMDLLGKSRQDAYDEGMRLLRTVGLAEKALNYPTSALDPTMVGEVETVIQDLSKTGKTMIIVTHELAFARAICNRAFFMDEGEIYEEGPPEQVFDNPQRKKTRRFVRRSKSLKLDVTSHDYDFISMSGEIDLYCRKNQLQSRQANRIRLAFEELVHQMLVPALEAPHIQVVLEYAEADARMSMTVYYNGPQHNIFETGDELSRSLLEGITNGISYDFGDADEFTNCLTLLF